MNKTIIIDEIYNGTEMIQLINKLKTKYNVSSDKISIAGVGKSLCQFCGGDIEVSVEVK